MHFIAFCSIVFEFKQVYKVKRSLFKRLQSRGLMVKISDLVYLTEIEEFMFTPSNKILQRVMLDYYLMTEYYKFVMRYCMKIFDKSLRYRVIFLLKNI